ncbi:MAG: sulfite exporter TauE/SafE family protein [Gammaproteobacteria bacterium]
MIYLVLIICGVCAWFISTIAAGGAATILIPVIGILLGAQYVAPIISLAALCSNPARTWFFREHVDWNVIKFLLPGSLIGAFIGAWSFSFLNPKWMQIVIALFLISYVFQYQFGKSKLAFKMKKILFFPLGLLISFLSGLVGATGPVLNPFMLNYGLEKENLVGTKSINSLAMQLTKLTTYTIFGVLTFEIALYGILLGIGGIIGVYLARHHLNEIDPERFRFYTMLMMFVAGVLMLLKQINF